MSSSADPFAGKYIVAPNGCWVWQRARHCNGYGSIGYQGKTHLVHRLMYQLRVGPVAPEIDVHHKCSNKLCINPAHLELQPHALHPLLAATPFTANATKTHCLQGHAFTLENTITIRGRRQCRTCVNARQRARRAARNAQKTHCRYGHEYTPENTIIDSGGRRQCRICLADQQVGRRPPQEA